jgi:hypothetical protein
MVTKDRIRVWQAGIYGGNLMLDRSQSGVWEVAAEWVSDAAGGPEEDAIILIRGQIAEQISENHEREGHAWWASLT